MFGKKKERDDFEIPAEFDLVEDKTEPAKKDTEKKDTDESYLDSLLDKVMGNHENDSPSDVEEIEKSDVVIIGEDEEFDEEASQLFDDILNFDSTDEEADTTEEDVVIIEDLLGDENIIPEEDNFEEEIEIPEESNAIENIEDYIERTDKEQSELLIDDLEEDFIPEHEDMLEDLDKIVSGKDEDNEKIHDEFDDEFFENIFSESESDDYLKESTNERKKVTEDDEIILQKAEEKLLNEKPKKKGFLHSLLAKFTDHDDEDESQKAVSKNNEDEEIDYFAENKRLFNELEEEENQDNSKKKKGKKEKKEKEPKKVKEKKPKDPELEEKVKVSGKGGFLIFSIIVVIIIAVLAGGSVLSYKQKLKDATDYFVTKDYANAYKMVATSNLKNTDQEFYMQLRFIMYVHRHYESYLNFTEMGYRTKALDALIKGVGNYNLYKDQGRDYNVMEEMQYSYNLIKEALSNEFGISESEAQELSAIEDRNVYSEKIYEIINDLE